MRPPQEQPVRDRHVAEPTITVVYDSKAGASNLAVGWGFAAVLSGTDRTILFDTGPGAELLENMRSLEIDPESIDAAVISHNHPDHAGGLRHLLRAKPGITVYVPKPSAKSLRRTISGCGGQFVEVGGPTRICPNVVSTGPLGRWIKEQSLIVTTRAGVVILAACSHPGILKIARKAKALTGRRIELVLGGFHLERKRKSAILKIVSAFERWKVKHVALGHCTADKAEAVFRAHFAGSCTILAAGTSIHLSDLA